jgi:hypothetical protein
VSGYDADDDGGEECDDDDLPAQIRDAVFVRLKAAFKDFKVTRRSPLLPIQNDQLPGLGVFLAEDTDSPDGDLNVGPPRFISDATIAISVIEDAPKSESTRRKIEARMNAIKNVLFKDASFVALTTRDGQPLLEGIARVRRTFSFPLQGDTFYAEGRLHIVCRFRCYYDPIAPNALTEVSVTAQPFGPGSSSQEEPAIPAIINLPGS